MTLNAFTIFDQAQETADGRGWKLTHWDDAVAIEVLEPTIEYYKRLTNPPTKLFTVTNKALTTNVATLTTSVSHGLVVGQVVLVTGVDTVFNGTYTITGVGANTFTYARTNANVGSVASGGSVRVAVLAQLSAAVTNKALTTNVVTLTTSGPHGFAVGDEVAVAIGDPIFDGNFVLTGVASTTFTYAKTNANVGSAAASGTVATALSLVDRLKQLYAAESDINGYFVDAAEAALIAANQATVLATTAASLAAEGLTP